jgi:hypothetical protein
VEVYFLYYALRMLYKEKEFTMAETLLHTHYGFMRERGAWCLVETLARFNEGVGSLCHGWACGNMVASMEGILGIRPAHPGDLSTVVLEPAGETLDWAEGTYPHPCGDLDVRWRIRGGHLFVEATLPADLELVFRPRGRLSRLPSTLRVRMRRPSGKDDILYEQTLRYPNDFHTSEKASAGGGAGIDPESKPGY